MPFLIIFSDVDPLLMATFHDMLYTMIESAVGYKIIPIHIPGLLSHIVYTVREVLINGLPHHVFHESLELLIQRLIRRGLISHFQSYTADAILATLKEHGGHCEDAAAQLCVHEFGKALEVTAPATAGENASALSLSSELGTPAVKEKPGIHQEDVAEPHAPIKEIVTNTGPNITPAEPTDKKPSRVMTKGTREREATQARLRALEERVKSSGSKRGEKGNACTGANSLPLGTPTRSLKGNKTFGCNRMEGNKKRECTRASLLPGSKQMQPQNSSLTKGQRRRQRKQMARIQEEQKKLKQ